MTGKTKTLDELLAEVEPERLAEIEKHDTAEFRDRIAAKRREEHERGVRLGWHDEDGNSLIPETDEEEEEENDDITEE